MILKWYLKWQVIWGVKTVTQNTTSIFVYPQHQGKKLLYFLEPALLLTSSNPFITD